MKPPDTKPDDMPPDTKPKDGIAALGPGWHVISPGGDTLCARGTPFSFFVRPGSVNKVIIDFRGGGACWDEMTCALASQIFDTEVTDDPWVMDEARATGIYDHNNDDNPFKDWHHVYVPYCTGDIHWGNNDKTYGTGDQAFTIHHRGAVNVRSVLTWMYANVAAPEKLFVSGCSAGAYGSILWSAHIRDHYKNTKLYQMADSGTGIITDTFFQDSFPSWNAAESYPTWISGLDAKVVTRLPQIYNAIGAYYPEMPLSEITTNFDAAQAFYFQAMGGGDATEWSKQMRASIAEIAAATPQFRSFISAGSEHCATPLDERFYMFEVNGRRLVDWVRDMVNDKPLESVTCTDCGMPAP